jgi:hypothetical protein
MEFELNKRFPYMGAVPFHSSDAKFFRGRDYETRRIVDEIFANRIFWLYAPSGAGKTSLLNAGVIPLLEKEGFEVLRPARVAGVLPCGLNAQEITNVYVFNSIRSWIESDVDLSQLSQKTLRDYLKERVHPLDEIGQPVLRAVIFDQLEELFSVSQEYWQHRAGFFQQIHEALQEDHLLRVIFGLREDFLGSMDSYSAFLTDKPQTRFRLELMREKDGLAALTEPLKETGRSFDVGVAEKLVEELLKIQVQTPDGEIKYVTGEFIEPVHLQVVCHRLWQTLPLGKKLITMEDLKALAGVNQTLSTFYDQTVGEVAVETGVNENLIREWFGRNLITPAGTRGAVLGGAVETGGLSNFVVERLVNRHLIRSEFRGGNRWYELAHDGFIQPIVQSNQRYSGKF